MLPKFPAAPAPIPPIYVAPNPAIAKPSESLAMKIPNDFTLLSLKPINTPANIAIKAIAAPIYPITKPKGTFPADFKRAPGPPRSMKPIKINDIREPIASPRANSTPPFAPLEILLVDEKLEKGVK